jgi:DNA-binding transcriptional MocR family regulator
LKRYELYAQELSQLIEAGTLRPGDKLPSVRQACAARQIGPATVFQAYDLLEARGLVRARPRSGYYVLARQPARPALPVADAQPVAVNDLVFDILSAVKDRRVAPLGSAFPSPALFPLDELRRAMGSAARRLDPWAVMDDLPPGHEKLRRQIALRYLAQGQALAVDEIVITHGALEALNLSLQAVTRPGDAVVIESPSFYLALQALERLGLRAIELPTDAREGLDLGALAAVLERGQAQACWLMTSFQNPLGATMPQAKKRELVALLARHQVPLIEDDVYAELHHGSEAVLPAKAYDREGLVMHCGSFSKSLAPGYRVGWVAGGRYAQRLQRLKLMNSLSGSLPAQVAVAAYLQEGGYDRHLRGLRQALASQQQAMAAAVLQSFPAGTRLSQPEGGYFLWAELPDGFDAMALYRQALGAQISVAPGPMFSASGRQHGRALRLNSGHPWSPELAQVVHTLGALARAAGG